MRLLGQVNTSATQPTSEETTAWYDLVGKFRNLANQFMSSWNYLLSQQAYVNAHPELKSDYTALMSRGVSLRSTIESTLSTIQGAMDWLKNWFGLGLIPLIPIAVLAGSIALVTKWVTDAYALKARIDEQQRLEAKGLTPQQAANVLKQSAGEPSKGIFDTLAANVQNIAIGAVVIGGVLIGVRYMRRRQRGT